jgi:stage II sporulation protein M
VPESTGGELKRYLAGYAALERGDLPETAVLFQTAMLYLRYPLAAFVLGMLPVGFGLLPLLAAAFGFFLSFAVCCFTATFGPEGLLTALAVMGIRCFVTLPCFLWLGADAFAASAELALASFGRGRRGKPREGHRHRWMRLAVVLAVLTVGLCVDLLWGPTLLAWAAERTV